MDITAILPPTNKAGLNFISILEKDGKQSEFKKIVTIIRSYTNANQHLLSKQVTMQYPYDVIYKDYMQKITEKFEEKYASYVLCILRKKYVDYLTDLRQLLDLCNECQTLSDYENNDNLNETLDEND